MYPTFWKSLCIINNINFLFCHVRLITQLFQWVGRLVTYKPVSPHQLDDCCYSNCPSFVGTQSLCNRIHRWLCLLHNPTMWQSYFTLHSSVYSINRQSEIDKDIASVSTLKGNFSLRYRYQGSSHFDFQLKLQAQLWWNRSLKLARARQWYSYG